MVSTNALKIFLINLDATPHRLSFMQTQFERLQLDVERVPAVIGRSVPEWLEEEFKDATLMSDGEVGCYASHLLVAHRIVAEGLPYAVVLEDDATLQDDFSIICGRAIQAAPAGWDFIQVCSLFKRSVVEVASLGKHSLIQYTRDPSGAVAYILSNAGARKWLRPMPRVRPNDIDNRYSWVQGLNIYGVYPSIVTHNDSFQSVAEHRNGRNFYPHPLAGLTSMRWKVQTIGPAAYFNGLAMSCWNSLRKRVDGKLRVHVVRNGKGEAAPVELP